MSGPSIAFRPALPSDAEFILTLRLDPEKNAHLSPTPPNVEAQRRWLKQPREGFYFIIEASDRRIGTVRLYDQRGTSFSWGSWILRDHPRTAATESALMVYRVGLELGFTAAHFGVRKANKKVWQFHERFGAARTGEAGPDFFYSIGKGAILAAFDRYGERAGAVIDW